MRHDSPDTAQAPRILIVDDTVSDLELLTDLLATRGYEPRSFSDGVRALEAARMDPPDLILLDVRMPVMDGYQVCERLKADSALHDIPVIFITGSAELADKVKAFAVGGADHVTKPFQIDEVVARVRTHLELRSLHLRLRDHNRRLEELVAERTGELAASHELVLEISRLKDEFFRMISREIRTPAAGLLGLGQLIIDLCPPSDDLTHFAAGFDGAGVRLRNLIEDATTLADLETPGRRAPATVAWGELIGRVRGSLAPLRVTVDGEAALASVAVKGEPVLLRRALATLIQLAVSFSGDKDTAHVRVSGNDLVLRLRLYVDALVLTDEQAAGFFKVESNARAQSYAEPLGLAPVVASKILSACGGGLRLVKLDGRAGRIEADLAKVQVHH